MKQRMIEGLNWEMLTWFGVHHQLTTCVHLETEEKHDCYTGRLAGKKKGWAPREKERGKGGVLS